MSGRPPRCSRTRAEFRRRPRYLGVPCFTLRDNTERLVTVSLGTNVLLKLEPRRIGAVPELLADRDRRSRPSIDGWDGNAAQRVADVLAGAALPSLVQLTEARRPRLQSANPDELQAA